ncbi:MAG: hypothetical protein ACLTJ5_12205 [Clostridium sp.]
MKNKKLSTTITITISIVAAVCILGLFFVCKWKYDICNEEKQHG